jgi:hypothetical protein
MQQIASSPEPRAPSASLILIREWEQQMSSSGCCGRLEGDLLSWNNEPLFADRRRMMEKAGELYRAVQERFPNSVHVQIVDPRNVPSLIPILLSEFRKVRVPWGAAFSTIRNLAVNTVIVNGRVFSAGTWPDAASLCEHLAVIGAESRGTQ